jgi:N-methylhydantoinase A/oxoprolinase/acetone carboxylase beta subunit
MRIGIDVGGTNTDAALVDGARVVASVKSSTTEEVSEGIEEALRALSERHDFTSGDIDAVMIGTTHFVNALVQARELAPTAAVRLGLPATSALPPMVGWPRRIVEAIRGRSFLCHGGHEFDGRTISELRPAELRAVAEQIGEAGISSVAITSVFSPVNDEFEVRAAEIMAEVLPDAMFSLSHEVGRIGLLERENATIISASLRPLAGRIVNGLSKTLANRGMDAPLYLSQNDGTLMDVAYALRYPVATFASGPTNSMRGAAFLSGVGTCGVIDVGGTTTDIGVLTDGFPREATTEVSIAGIRTNFRMPDVLSIGLGGGSRIRTGGPQIEVGPDSVGYRITAEALVFGGSTLTATDIAVAAGRTDIGDRSLVAHLDPDLVARAHNRIGEVMADAADRMRPPGEELPVVAVGGGSVLVPDVLPGFGSVLRPDHFEVANAVGAAIAQVSGDVDRVFSVSEGRRGEVLDAAKAEAVDRAVAAGADPATVGIVEVDEVPIAYLPGNATRIRVKAVGDLTLGRRAASGSSRENS